MAVIDSARADTTVTITVPAGTTITTNDISNIVWSGWLNGGTGSTTTGFTDPWPIWAHEQSLTSTSATHNPWITWNDSFSTGNRFTATIRMGVERERARALNPELEAARRRQQAADRLVYETRRRQNEAKRAAADERAEKLLMSILSGAQQAQYRAERRFVVHLPNGNHYMIRRGRHGNIERIDEGGKRIENLCVHVAPYEVPDADNLAAQKLWLECDEAGLRKIANIAPYAA